MKKLKLLALIASFGILVGCNQTPVESGANQNSDVVESNIRVRLSGDGTIMLGKTTEITVRISRDTTNSGFNAKIEDESIATMSIEDTKITITGKAIGQTILRVSSVADPSVVETLDINVVPVSNPTLSLAADKEVVTQNGTVSLTATVTDYTGEVSYSWKSLYQKGNFSGDKTSGNVTFNANSFGSDTIQVSVIIGNETYTATVDLFIKADHTNWTAISTAAEFKEKLLAESTITGNFYLTADIDLNGEIIKVHTGNAFAGKLDGQGYSVKNYVVHGQSDNKSNGGLFGGIEAGAILANIGFENVTIPELGTGWGTSVIACNSAGMFENIFVSAIHTFDGSALMDSSNWFPFVSAFVGVMKEGSSYRNIVVDVDKSNQGGYATMFADVAYPAGGSAGLNAQNAQTFSVDGFYTNSDVVYGSIWEWGSPVEDQSGYHININWTNANSSVYDGLDSHIWNVEQGKRPELIELA